MREKVSIILLNWNGGEFTKPCIESLNQISYFNYDIIVVDNGSTDGSADMLKMAFTNIILLKNEKNLGFTGGNNIGIKYALEHGADYVLILNNDTIVDKNFLSEMVRVLESDRQIGMVTCKIFSYDDPKKILYAGGVVNKMTLKSKHISKCEKDNGKYSVMREIDFITGCCMLVRKALIEKIGAFDEKFFAYAEDLDWSLRTLKADYKLIYAPSAKLWHKESASVRKNTLGRSKGTATPFQYYLVNRNRIFILKKHGNIINYFFGGMLLSFSVFYMSIGLTILRRWTKLLALWNGIIDGIRTP